jgi:TPP-dependent pyruvate/acetoin dehydrogenase alpha subunit
VKEWEARDPILRLERYLIRTKLLTDEEVIRLREQSLACAQTAFEEVEREPDEVVEDTFRYHYLELPEIMERQLERRKS